MSWTLIEHQALTSSAASVTLGSGGTIPQTYKTLMVLISARPATNPAAAIMVTFNGATANRSNRYVEGNGSSTSSSSSSDMRAGVVPSSSDTANTFSNISFTIPNYSVSAAKPSSVDSVTENNGTTAYQDLMANLWNDTAAITTIAFTLSSSANFVSGSTFTLYGLA